MRIRRRRFEALVREAVAGLPPDIRQAIDNVEIVVEDWPTDDDLAQAGVPDGDTLFGLYVGVPLTERASSYTLALPDRIVIFQGPIEESCHTWADIVNEVRVTVVHELAHHFGISDARLAELGWA